MSSRLSAIAMTLCLVLSSPIGAGAQEGRNGIAFVQAVEQGSGVCTGKDAASAFACARAKCTAEGAAGEDCTEQAWCSPAFWSVDVFLQHQEGPHWHEYYCGWNSRELALAAARTACDKALRPYLIECAAVMVYDEDGKEHPVE